MAKRTPIFKSISPELMALADSLISAYLGGEISVQELATRLASSIELDAANDVLDELVEAGRITRDEANAIAGEFQSKRAIENGVAATAAAATGGYAAVTMVSTAGSVAGLSASGVTSGLAALGAVAGGGMAAGLVVVAGGAFVVGAGTFWVAKRAARTGRRMLAAKKEAST